MTIEALRLENESLKAQLEAQSDRVTALEMLSANRDLKRKMATANRATLFAAVEAVFDVNSEEIFGKRRKGKISEARHVAMTLMFETEEITITEVGAVFGFDRKVVNYARGNVQRLCETEPAFRDKVETLRQLVLSPTKTVV